MSIKAGSVMDAAAVLLNDYNHTTFTYVAQIPFLNIAIDELAEEMERENKPSTNVVSKVYVIPTTVTDIGGGTGQPLPLNLIEIQVIEERLNGTTNPWTPITRKEFLPSYDTLVTDLVYWAWEDQAIKFLGATSARDVRLKYIGNTLQNVTDENSDIFLINCKTWLEYRTAALCSAFIGENETRATELNTYAGVALNRFLGIASKGRQQIAIRRRPFMSNYRSGRGWGY